MNNVENRQFKSFGQSFIHRVDRVLWGLVFLAAGLDLQAANGTWINNVSSTWSNTVNWAGGIVAEGDAFTADFSTVDITLNRSVTLDGPHTISTLITGDRNPTHNWTFAGLAGSTNGLTLGTNAAINVINQVTTISGPLGGTNGFIKIGEGNLTLGGSNKTVTGGINVRAGVLTLNFPTTGSPNSDLVNPSNTLFMSGGTLIVTGKTAVVCTQSFTNTVFTPGMSILTGTNASGNTFPYVNLGNLTFQLGAAVRFQGLQTADINGLLPATIYMTTTSTAPTNAVDGSGVAPWGLLFGGGAQASNSNPAYGGYATVGLYDWASVYGSDARLGTLGTNFIQGGSQVPGFYVTDFPNATGNWDMTLSTALSSGNKVATTIRYNTAAANVLTLNNASSGTVPCILQAGGILITPAMGQVNSILTYGTQGGSRGNWQIWRNTNPDGSQEGVIWQNNIYGFFNVYVDIPNGRDAGDINNIVVNGEGTTFFYGLSSYSGRTFINSGVLGITNNACLGSQTAGSSINLNRGTLLASETFSLDNSGANARAVTLYGNGGGLAATGTNVLTVSGLVGSDFNVGPLTIGIAASAVNQFVQGQVPGSGVGTANDPGLMAVGMVVLTNANFYTGGTVIESGTLNINGIYALGGANYGGLAFKGGALKYAPSFSGNGPGDLSVGNSVAFITNNATIDLNGNNVAYVNSIGRNGGGGLVVKSSLPGGVLELQSSNSYSGGTYVVSGTLKIGNSAGSGVGSGSVVVSNTGTLAGNGIVSGAVQLISGGALSPGASVGKLTVGSLSLNAGGVIKAEFNTANATNDQVVVTSAGGLTLNGGAFYLYKEGGVFPMNTLGTYQLIQFSGAVGGVGLDASWTTASGVNPHIANPQAGFTYSFAITGGWLTVTIGANANIGTWGLDANGNWSQAANWVGTFGSMPPRNANDSAAFGISTSQRTVTLDVNETVGGVIFNNSNSFVIANAGNTLKFDASGSGASITVVEGGNNSIQTAVSLSDNLSIAANQAKKVALTAAVGNTSAAKTINIVGDGVVALSGNNSYGPAAGSVGTTISGVGGVVELGHDNALAAGDVSITASNTLRATKAALNVANNIVIADAVNAGVDNSGNDVNIAGIISGNGSLTKMGNGRLSLPAANTYAGTTTVSGGQLSINQDSGIGAVPAAPLLNSVQLVGGTLVGDGTFALDGNRTVGLGLASGNFGDTGIVDAVSGQIFTINGTIASAGNTGTNHLVINGGAGHDGIVALAGTNTYRGNTTVSNGTLRIANPLALQNSTLVYNVGVMDFGDQTAATLGGLVSTINIPLQNLSAAAVALTVGNNGSSSTYPASFSGSGSLTKVGAGAFLLTGSNAFTGTVNANAGTLRVTNGASVACGATSVSGLLDINGGTYTSTGLATVNSGGTGNGLWLTAGTATFDNMRSGQNDGGLIKVTGGTLTTANINLRRTVSFPNAPTVTAPLAGATTTGFYVNGSNATANLVSLDIGTGNSSASARVDAGNVSVSGRVRVGYCTPASSRWNILHINGGSFISSDTVEGIVISPNNGTVLAGNGEVYLSGGVTVAERVAFGAPDNTAGGLGFLLMNGGTLYLGSGGLVQSDVTGLYTNTIGLNAGILGFTADQSLTLDMTLTGTNFAFQCADSNGTPHNVTITAALTGTGGMTKTGNGLLTLDHAVDAPTNNTYAGNTVVAAGTLAILNGAWPSNSAVVDVRAGVLDITALPGSVLVLNSNQTLAGGGTVWGGVVSPVLTKVAPGSGGVGKLTITNSITLQGSNIFEVSHIGSVVTNDQLAAQNITVSPTATLEVTIVTNSAFTGGESFKLFSKPVSGFGSVSLPALDAGLTWTNKLAVDGSIAVLGSIGSTVSTNSTNIVRSISGKLMTLTWPDDHVGWRLQMQTNSLALGLRTNGAWVDVPGANLTNSVTVSLTNAPASFFRMVYP